MNSIEKERIIKDLQNLSNSLIEDTLINISKEIINLSNYQTLYIEELKRRKYSK